MKAGTRSFTMIVPMPSQMPAAAIRPTSKATRRRPAVFEDQYRREAADQPDAAAGGEIDVAGQDDEKHAQREDGGDRDLDGQHRKVAGGKKFRRLEGKEQADGE